MSSSSPTSLHTPGWTKSKVTYEEVQEEQDVGKRMFLNGVRIILQDDKETKFEEVTTLYKKSC
jgi:hypothetical protein